MPVQIDMELPESCDKCKFCQEDEYSPGYFCFLNGDCCEFSIERPDWCLLKEMTDPTWHVVADGDLPPKPESGIKRYLVTKVSAQDLSRKIVTDLYWDGNGFYQGFFRREIHNVLAWRELPEPWEGAVK